MTSKTNFINYFLLAFTLAFISSGLSAGTLDFKDKKKDKEKKEELTADGPYVLYQPDGQISCPYPPLRKGRGSCPRGHSTNRVSAAL